MESNMIVALVRLDALNKELDKQLERAWEEEQIMARFEYKCKMFKILNGKVPHDGDTRRI